jgi:acyl carrier protein
LPALRHLLWFNATSAGWRLHDAELRDSVLRLLAEFHATGGKELSPTSSFREDMGIDSLDLVALIMEMEEEFDVTIGDAEAEGIRTVADAIDVLERLRRHRQ